MLDAHQGPGTILLWGGGVGVGRFVLIQFEVQFFVGATGKGLSI